MIAGTEPVGRYFTGNACRPVHAPFVASDVGHRLEHAPSPLSYRLAVRQEFPYHSARREEEPGVARLEILRYPDPRLRRHAEPVGVVDDNVRRLIDDMLETMYDASGVGLAAPQVGVTKSVVTIDVSQERNEPLCLVDPRIHRVSGTMEAEEGCLSFPGVFETVKRAENVVVAALDRDGQPLEVEAAGLLAICIQHEIDHLSGRLFVDHLSRLKRQRIRKRAEKQFRRA